MQPLHQLSVTTFTRGTVKSLLIFNQDIFKLKIKEKGTQETYHLYI